MPITYNATKPQLKVICVPQKPVAIQAFQDSVTSEL